MFKTASPPSVGECRVIKGDIVGLDVLNTIVCDGWTSSSGSTDLLYQYFYKTSPSGMEYMFQYVREPSIGRIRLPIGLKEYNYTLFMKAVISDRSRSKAETHFEYLVRFNFLEYGQRQAVTSHVEYRLRRRSVFVGTLNKVVTVISIMVPFQLITTPKSCNAIVTKALCHG